MRKNTISSILATVGLATVTPAVMSVCYNRNEVNCCVSWWVVCGEGEEPGSIWQCPQTSNSQSGFVTHVLQASPQGIYGGFSNQDILILVGSCTITPRSCGDPKTFGCVKGNPYTMECWDRANTPFCNQ